MRFSLKTMALGLIVSALAGCASLSSWSTSHPSYKHVPYGEIAVTGVQNAFVLTRSSWFAKRLELGTDSIQIKGSAFCSNAFKEEIARTFGKVQFLPDSLILKYPEESQRIDDRIFIKGHFPEQGISIKDADGKIPPVILILHEFIVGTDLSRKNFFDYAHIHNESGEKTRPKNTSAVFSYTLWDNVKQRPLFSAIEEFQQPITKFTQREMKELVQSCVRQIRKQIYGGTKK